MWFWFNGCGQLVRVFTGKVHCILGCFVLPHMLLKWKCNFSSSNVFIGKEGRGVETLEKMIRVNQACSSLCSNVCTKYMHKHHQHVGASRNPLNEV